MTDELQPRPLDATGEQTSPTTLSPAAPPTPDIASDEAAHSGASGGRRSAPYARRHVFATRQQLTQRILELLARRARRAHEGPFERLGAPAKTRLTTSAATASASATTIR